MYSYSLPLNRTVKVKASLERDAADYVASVSHRTGRQPTQKLIVCFITKSFLTYSFFHLHLLYQSYLGLCQATCVHSQQRQPRSAVAIGACEIQVSAADSQTVPTVVNGVSKPLRCRLTLTFTLTSDNLSLYTTLLLYWSLYHYAAHTADILTPTTVVQGVENRSRGVYCRRCSCFCVCWGRSSRIFHFSHWLSQVSTVLTKDESPLTGYTFTAWVVSFTPPSMEHSVGGTSILRLIRRTMESHMRRILANPGRTAWQV